MLALGLVGVAVMLGVLHGSFHWVLAAVPGVAIIIALLAALAAARPGLSMIDDLRSQLDADVRALRVAENAMAADRQPLTPQQRLALSRRAPWSRSCRRPAPDAGADELYALPAPAVRPAAYDHFAWSSVARGVVRRWWRRHPANAAGQLARPLLERYAREEPAKLVGARRGRGPGGAGRSRGDCSRSPRCSPRS